jgi:uncharacterized protein with ParB-like and HNH nuclease domain
MANGKIDANKEVLQTIFSKSFWFVIPEYQRSYVWQTDNIIELIEDLTYAYENKPENDYFLGSLVLKKLPNDEFPEYEVLDGQQRLTTFFIMMAVLRDSIGNSLAKETLQKTIYQEENLLVNIPERMRITYKIRDNVEDFIKSYIIRENGTSIIYEINKYKNEENISLSNMANAIITIRNIFKDKDDKELFEFVRFILNKALFIYVSTDNTEDAFRMFTILNDRGIPLTNADILKSQNIGALVNEKDVNKYARMWEEIEGKYGDGFDRFLQYVRTILVKEKARTNLLDEFNQKVYDVKLPNMPKLKRGKETFELINLYSNIYDGIIELSDDKLSNNYKNLVTIMKIGLRSEDWIPAIMRFFAKFKYDGLDEFLKQLEYKFVGDWVCGITPTLRLDAMNNILKVIDDTDKSNVTDLLNNSKMFQINKDDFINNISGDIYKKQYSRYLLLKQEFLLSENTVHLSGYNYITVEHILPQNPPQNSEWCIDFTEDQRCFWTNKIANLVLISQRKNSALGNSDFKKKKEVYLKKRIDAFNANKVFIEQNSQWTPDVLEKRQKYILSLLIENKW